MLQLGFDVEQAPGEAADQLPLANERPWPACPSLLFLCCSSSDVPAVVSFLLLTVSCFNLFFFENKRIGLGLLGVRSVASGGSVYWWVCVGHLQGLGLVVTGTMPVFNLTMDGNSQVFLRHPQPCPWILWWCDTGVVIYLLYFAVTFLYFWALGVRPLCVVVGICITAVCLEHSRGCTAAPCSPALCCGVCTESADPGGDGRGRSPGRIKETGTAI